MGAVSTITPEIYTLADVLGMTLTLEGGTRITAKGTRTRVFGDLTFDVPVVVISSCVAADAAAILVRTIGNLGLLFVAGHEKTSTVVLFVVDFARMGKPENIMEEAGTADPRKAPELMGKAIVATYAKGASKKWDRRT